MNKEKPKNEIVKEIRKRAQEILKLCEDAEQGKISAEEFERRITKLQVGGGDLM